MLPTDDMTGVMDGPVRTFIQLYNDQPKFFDLPEEDAARFAALETLCKLHDHLTHLFHLISPSPRSRVSSSFLFQHFSIPSYEHRKKSY
jgi:hypothetical protein